MKKLFLSRYRCPFCLSENVVPASPKTFVCTGAGGLAGGVIAALACKDEAGVITAGPVVAGTVIGAMAGLSVGKAIQKDVSGKPYICLSCYKTFTPFTGLQNTKRGEGMKNQADEE